MKRMLLLIGVIVLVTAVEGVISGCQQEPEDVDVGMEQVQEGPLYGGEADVSFANSLWTSIQGYENWKLKSDFYPGASPHGAVLRMYYNVVNVNGEPRHVIIKDNYGGEGANPETVAKNPSQYLGAVTIMVQREEGFDPDNMNWYYVGFMPDGTLNMDPQNVPVAGKVTSCLDCHRNAQGGDFIFTNDKT